MGSITVCLYNPSGALVSCGGGGTGVSETISHTATVSGNWRLLVSISSGTGSYTLSASAGSPENDCGTGSDAGGSYTAASAITLPKTNCSGSLIASIDTDDWYQFAVSSGQTINVSVTPNAGADFDICLDNPSITNGYCSFGTMSHMAAESGNWHLRVYISSGTGNYTMSVSTS